MEGEMGASARIAIALIVLAVLMAVIFVILGFTRGATNEGITSVQNSMDAMQISQFDDYDQKTLSGAQVSSAIKLMDGKPVAMVVVNTKQNVHMTTAAVPHTAATGNVGWAAAGYKVTGNARLAYKSPDAGIQSSDTLAGDKVFFGGGTGILKNDGHEIDWRGTNYGALLKIDEPAGPSVTPYNVYYRYMDSTVKAKPADNKNTEANILALPDSEVIGLYRSTEMSNYIGMLVLNGDGTIPTNNQTLKTRQSGSEWFIRGTSKYMSRLIRDTTGSIIGVVFIQTA